MILLPKIYTGKRVSVVIIHFRSRQINR
ncbi:hypothetical protein [Enterobacter cancerogenus]